MRGHIVVRGKKDEKGNWITKNYSIVVELQRDSSGKRKQKWFSGYKTKKEAEKALTVILHDVDNDQFFLSKKITFGNYLDEWLRDEKINNICDKTAETYKQLIDWYIMPKLGGIPLSSLNAAIIRYFYNYLQEDLNLSRNTTLQCHSIIHKSLEDAITWGYINNNASQKVRPKKLFNVEMKVLNLQQAKLLLNALKNTTMYTPTLLCLNSGLRRSEILALKWDNVDFKNKCLYVKKQVKYNKEIKQYELVKLKTQKSERCVCLPDFIIEYLEALQEKQLINKKNLGDKYNDNNLVHCKITGEFYKPDAFSRDFSKKMKSLSEKLNIPRVRFHDLRHTHATLLLASGINLKVISERLGHEDTIITSKFYTHVLPEMEKKAALVLDNLMIK